LGPQAAEGCVGRQLDAAEIKALTRGQPVMLAETIFNVGNARPRSRWLGELVVEVENLLFG
jgi:hypothetical protein